MAEGKVIRTLSEFFTVSSDGKDYICKARGKCKNGSSSPLVGDLVEFELNPDGSGIISSVRPRKNAFIRPPLANLDALIMVVSHTVPVTDPFLIDKMAVIAEMAKCAFIICVNKTDLSSDRTLQEIYGHTSYPVVSVSARTGQGTELLRKMISGKTSALTGNSGVGKSSLLNCLVPSLQLPTGELSDRYGRGKHTTRHTELYQLDSDTFLADTAGFSSFEINQVTNITKNELKDFFPEISAMTGMCRYPDCAHVKEPSCAVREAVESGQIASTRYESYLKIYDSVSKNNAWNPSNGK